jgi:acyl-CoA synthetase (AMP-forming)/AMP-acid ligase II
LLFAGRHPASLAFLAATSAEQRAFSCLNPRWRWPQVRKVLQATGAQHLFVDAEGRAVLEPGMDAAERETIQLIDLRTALELTPVEHAVTSRRGSASAEHVGAMLFTSGSTGEPKGVCISESDLVARAEAEVAWYGLDTRDVLLNLLPWSFDVGLNQIMAAASAGACTVVVDSWLPMDVWRTAAEQGITGIPCVPSIWQDMVNAELSFDTRGVHAGLRFITVSGGDLPPAHRARLPGLAPGVAIFKTYGQTEAFRACSLRPSQFLSHGESVGGAFPGVTVSVVRADGQIARRGEIGELVHEGLGVMMGYLGDPLRTQQKLRPGPTQPDQLAAYSGDNAYIDGDGCVHLVGRDDQMLKINGNRVYPAEVRNALCELSGVRDALVLAETLAEGPVLVAYLQADLQASPEEWARRARATLPGYMVPRLIVPRDELPRTLNGKPDAQALRADAQQRLQEAGFGLVQVVESRPQVAAAEGLPRAPETSEVARWIEQFVQERVSSGFVGSRHALAGVVDSLTWLELLQMLERRLGTRLPASRLDGAALASTSELAAAVLALRASQGAGRPAASSRKPAHLA